MAAPVDEKTPRVAFEKAKMNPTWHADIYRATYKLENMENLEPGKVYLSDIALFGTDGFKFGIKQSADPLLPDSIGLYLYKVLY
jgi:hypothetical protein